MADVRQLIAAAAARYGLDPDLLLRMAQAESSLNPNAVSPTGATGVMQLMPATARDLGVDPRDPGQNIAGGAQYLRQLLDRYHGDQRLALAAYNAGPGKVDRAGGVPDIPETQAYVDRLAGRRRPVATTEESAAMASWFDPTKVTPYSPQEEDYLLGLGQPIPQGAGVIGPETGFRGDPGYSPRADVVHQGEMLRKMQEPPPPPDETVAGHNDVMQYFGVLMQLGATVAQAIAASKARKKRGGTSQVLVVDEQPRGGVSMPAADDWQQYMPGGRAG